jgi:drug/metabolite transporter (DMT)-like permease
MLLGALGALGSSFTWAFASTRYAQASRTIGAARVNLLRALTVAPLYTAYAVLALGPRQAVDTVRPAHVGWLTVSVLCSYAIADNLFFAAAARIGVSTSLSIASIYPMWSALYGVGVRGETLSALRAVGMVLCIGGVIALVRLARASQAEAEVKRVDAGGLVLAFFTSFLWAGNTISVKLGSERLDVAQVNAIRFLIAALLLGGQLVALRPPPSTVPIADAWRRLIPAIAADAIFGSIFFVYGLSHTDLAVGATLSSLSPLISVPLAIALGEERWSTPRAIAITVTVAGIVLLVSGGPNG